jgi:peptidoglycan-associated lipoprotein
MRNLSLIIMFSLSLALVGCGSSKKKSVVEEAPAVETPKEESFEVNGDSDGSKAGGLRTVHFEYDSAQISDEAKSVLDANAEFLKANAGTKIQVEGHCDERGSVQYNLALGERRAKSVKQYLATKGVNSKSITTISFGKERPIDSGHDEGAWGQNRRANFVVTTK